MEHHVAWSETGRSEQVRAKDGAFSFIVLQVYERSEMLYVSIIVVVVVVAS